MTPSGATFSGGSNTSGNGTLPSVGQPMNFSTAEVGDYEDRRSYEPATRNRTGRQGRPGSLQRAYQTSARCNRAGVGHRQRTFCAPVAEVLNWSRQVNDGVGSQRHSWAPSRR